VQQRLLPRLRGRRARISSCHRLRKLSTALYCVARFDISNEAQAYPINSHNKRAGIVVSEFESPDESIRPTREGLPPSYRMRADRHYVDLIATRGAAGHERMIPIASLDPPGITDVPALVPLIDSVKQHGVLQPLLVREREGTVRVIAGQRRLAASIAAGLREVPCLVHDVDDETAEQLRTASNLSESAAAVVPAPATADPAAHSGEDLARSLSTASSLAELLTGQLSELSRGVIGGLLRAELFRATTVVQATRVVHGELPLVRGGVPVAHLLDKVLQGFAAERRVRHVEIIPHVDVPPGHIVIADEQLLTAALGGAVLATMALLDGLSTSRMSLVAGLTASRQLTLVASQDHVLPSPAWADRAFDPDWRERPGGTTVALAMATLQRAAQVHGGTTTAGLSPRGTRVGLTIPAGV
jgi:signal transduction histidine kinase